MKDIKSFINDINESIFQRSFGVMKRLNKIEVKDSEWETLNSCSQSAMCTLLWAIDYMAENAEKFSNYNSVENAVRDAVNNVLDEHGYSKKLTIA